MYFPSSRVGLASWAREVLVGALAWLLRIHRRGPAVEVEAIQAITRVVRIEESKRRGYETDPGHDLRLGRANPFGATGSALALAVASGKREASDGEQQESLDSVTHGRALVQPVAGTAAIAWDRGDRDETAEESLEVVLRVLESRLAVLLGGWEREALQEVG